MPSVKLVNTFEQAGKDFALAVVIFISLAVMQFGFRAVGL